MHSHFKRLFDIIAAVTLITLIAILSLGISAQPALAAKKGNMDSYIGLGSSKIVIATAKGANSQTQAIYKSKSTDSKVIFRLQGQSCIVCDMSGMKKGAAYDFVKVKLPKCSPSSGYINTSKYTFGIIDTSDFGISASPYSTKAAEKTKRVKACKYALTLLGTSYPHGNVSGLTCNQLLNKCYQYAGYGYSANSAAAYNKDTFGSKVGQGVPITDKNSDTSILCRNLRAGDILFYKGLDGVKDHHVAMYLGNGYVVQSTADQGKTYPRAGVRITKLVFRSGPTIARVIKYK